jgi:hypothetical protein
MTRRKGRVDVEEAYFCLSSSNIEDCALSNNMEMEEIHAIPLLE